MNKSEKKSLCFFGDKKKLLSLPPQIRLGDVAQSVEQRTENPCVGGSIPSITTERQSEMVAFFYSAKRLFISIILKPVDAELTAKQASLKAY